MLPLPRSPAPCRHEPLYSSRVYSIASPPRRRRECLSETFIGRVPESVFTVFRGSSMTGSESPFVMMYKRGIALKRIKLPLVGGLLPSEQPFIHSSFPNIFQASHAPASAPWEKGILLVTNCRTGQNCLLGGQKGPNTQKDEDAEGKTRAPECINSGLRGPSWMRLGASTFSRVSNLK